MTRASNLCSRTIDLIAQRMWDIAGMLRKVPWTRRWLICSATSGAALCAIVVWLCVGAGTPDEKVQAGQAVLAGTTDTEPEGATGPAVRNNAANDQEAAPATQAAEGAVAQLTDEEILRSSDLTYEQKRSQLYDLAAAASETIENLRSGTNYVRTCARLERLRVRFTDEAERAFTDLVERIENQARALDWYCATVNRRLEGIRLMEPVIYEQVRAGTLDPQVRDLYVALSSGKVSRYTGHMGAPDVERVRRRIVRRNVSGQDLFEQLASVRCGQRCLQIATMVDDQITKFLTMVPDKALALGHFTREWALVQNELEAAQSQLAMWEQTLAELPERIRAAEAKVEEERAAVQRLKADEYVPFGSARPLHAAGKKTQELQRSEGQIESHIRASRSSIERIQSQLDAIMPLTSVWGPEQRTGLLAQLARDAGVLEEALGEHLLDYPWPWPVETVQPEQRVFELTGTEP